MALEELEKRIVCDDGEMVGKMTIIEGLGTDSAAVCAALCVAVCAAVWTENVV